MAEHTLRLIIEAIDRAQGTFSAVEGRIRGLEATTRATGTSLAGTLNGIQQGFNQLGGAASTGIHAITSGLDPLRGALDTINAGVQSIQGNVSRVSTTFGGLIAAIPIVMGIGAANQFMSKSLQDAGKETQNFIALQATWRAQGRGTEEELGTLIEQVKTLSRTSSYASQDVIAGMNFLAGFPAVATKDLLPALQTAIDFAAYQNVGIQEATRILGFAATGRTAWLEHFYGFKFTEATKASKDFSKILGEMQERVAGQEAAKMETYAGAVGMLEKSFNRVEKAIGHVLEAAIVPVLKDLVGYFSDFGKAVEDAFNAGATEEWVDKFREVFQRIADYTKGVFDGIRSFATEGGFDRIFGALEKVSTIMQTLISVAGKLLGWLVMLPKPVLQFIAVALGLTVLVKIGLSIYNQWSALWRMISSGKVTIADYATKAIGWLGGEKKAVDAVTAAYVQRNIAAAGGMPRGAPVPIPGSKKPSGGLTPAYGAENLQTTGGRQAYIEANAPEYAGRYTSAGSKWKRPVVEEAAMGTGMIGYALGSISTLAYSIISPIIKEASNAIFGDQKEKGWSTTNWLRENLPMVPTLTPETEGAITKLFGGDVGKSKTEETYEKQLKSLQEQGYGLESKLRPIASKEELAKMGAKDLVEILKDEQKELDAQAAKLHEIRRTKSETDKETGKETNEEVKRQDKLISKIRERMQMIRELTRKQQQAEKPPETVNLLEEVKAIREKHKLIMELAKSEFQEKKTLLQLELAERKAVIAETVQSTILAQQAILKAEQENTAKRMQLIVQNYKETKQLQEEAYNEERARLQKNLQSGDSTERQKAVRELAKLDREYAKQQVDTARQTTSELEKELQKQYELRAQLNKKITALEQEARDAQRATAQSIRSINEAAASEHDRLRMKLEDAQKKLQEATEQMPKFPEKALQLAKEAQSAFAGLAQNIDSLEQNIRNSQQLVADALRNIEQSRLTGVAKWRAELGNLQTDMQRAQQFAAEGRYKEAEAAYKRVISQAQSLASSAPASMKGYARQETSAVVSQAGKELAALQDRQLTEAKALNTTATDGITEAGNLIADAIRQQIEAAHANIKALEENTKALKELIAASRGEEVHARERAQEEIKKMNEPQKVPKQGEAQEPGTEASTPAESDRRAEEASRLDQERIQKEVKKEEERRAIRERPEKAEEARRKAVEAGAEAWRESAPEKTPEETEREAAQQAGAIAGGMGGPIAAATWERKPWETAEEHSTRLNREVGGRSMWHQRRPGETEEEWRYRVQELQKAEGAFDTASTAKGDEYYQQAEEFEQGGDTAAANVARRLAGSFGVSKGTVGNIFQKALAGAAEQAAAMNAVVEKVKPVRGATEGEMGVSGVGPADTSGLPGKQTPTESMQNFQKATSEFVAGVRELLKGWGEPIEVRAKVSQEGDQFAIA